MSTATEPTTTRTEQLKDRRKPLQPALIVFFAVFIAVCILYADTAFETIDEPLETFPGVELIARIATSTGGRAGGAILALIVICLTGRHWKRAGITILCGAAVQTGITELLKHLAGRPRPDELDDITVFFGPGTSYHSFPSGHASFAFMLATVAAAYFPRWRWLSYGVAILIAASRVMLDRHFLSDVMVGGLVGFAAAYIFLRVWPAPKPIEKRTIYSSMPD